MLHWRPRFSLYGYNLIIFVLAIQVDELLKQRDSIHSSFTVSKPTIQTSGDTSSVSNGNSSKIPSEDGKADSPGEDGSSDGKDKSTKKRWLNFNLKGSADKRSA